MPEPRRTPEECWTLAWENRGLAYYAVDRAFPGRRPHPALSRLGGREEAVQVALLRLWQLLPGWDPARGALSTYLLRPLVGALRKAADRCRVVRPPALYGVLRSPRSRACSRQARRYCALPVRPPSSSAEPWEGPAAAEEVSLLRAALAALPEPDSSVVRLRFFEGLTRREVGRRLGGFSHGWAQGVEARALSRLRTELTRKGVAG